MDPQRFTSDRFGRPAKEPGQKAAFWYFSPAPLPRELELAPGTVRALSDADSALGHLNGLAHLIHDPELFVGPYLTREAVASSRIEGTQTSLSEVLKSEASGAPTTSEDVAEVERYVRATQRGFEAIRTLPITQRLITELHAILLSGVRGADRLPGELRRSPVWIGSPTDRPETATFVPPLPSELPEAMTDWEKFVNTEGDAPVLVKCALMHYQFETIHPFLDGNGRIGRLLINLLLTEERRLTQPLLYLSGYLESHRDEYYERLRDVRERGRIQEWLQFFFTAVRRQADDGVTRAEALVSLCETYLAGAARTRSKLGGLVNLLFENYFVTVTRVERSLEMTNAGARNLVRDAERRGWLKEVGASGRGGKTYWVASEISEIIESPPAYTGR